MFRLIAVTLAALYAILYVFGDETRRPDTVARAEPMRLAFAAPAFDLFAFDLFNDSPDPVLLSGISEAEAVEMALAAGRAYRNEEPRTAPVSIASADRRRRCRARGKLLVRHRQPREPARRARHLEPGCRSGHARDRGRSAFGS